jgi:FAD:protein FMN transferase
MRRVRHAKYSEKACNNGIFRPVVHVSDDRNHMATTFELRIACPSEASRAAERALADCHALIETLEAGLTEFRQSSPVARLNSAKPFERVSLPETAWRLLEDSRRIEELTGGAFSASAKSAGAGLFASRFGLDASARAAWRLDEGARLGFGAIGKGFALDRCRELLERAGFNHYLLSGGGSSVVLAGFADGAGSPWTWAWSWARDAEDRDLGLELAHPTGSAIGIGVSGLHEKGEHLLDPRSGSPASGMRSALAGHPSAAWADALSTALFVGGWEQALERFQHALQPPALAMIDETGVPRWNGGFQALFGPIR